MRDVDRIGQHLLFCISADSEEYTTDGELAAVSAWAEANQDIENIVLFTMSEDESQENTTLLLQDTLDDIGLTILDIVDVKMTAQTEDYAQYAIQALNSKADGYVFLIRGKYYGNILKELRKRGVEEGRRVFSSFSAWDSDLADIAGEALDGTYRVSVFASQTLDTLPTNPGYIIATGIADVEIKDSYKYVFIATVLNTTITAIVVALLLTIFPGWA